jgi:hypothetical protein
MLLTTRFISQVFFLIELLPLKNLVDCDLAALFDGDHFVYGLESRQGDIDHVIPRSHHYFQGRHLVQDALVNHHLGSLGLCANAD